jgi:hypothetical protein
MDATSDLFLELTERLSSTSLEFAEIVALVPVGRYRDLIEVWGLIRETGRLSIDDHGRYRLVTTNG